MGESRADENRLGAGDPTGGPGVPRGTRALVGCVTRSGHDAAEALQGMARVIATETADASVVDGNFGIAIFGDRNLARDEWLDGDVSAWVEGDVWSLTKDGWTFRPARAIAERARASGHRALLTLVAPNYSRKKVTDVIEAHMSGGEHTRVVCTLLTLELWLRQLEDPSYREGWGGIDW